jgi:hypothetical protein
VHWSGRARPVLWVPVLRAAKVCHHHISCKRSSNVLWCPLSGSWRACCQATPHCCSTTVRGLYAAVSASAAA